MMSAPDDTPPTTGPYADRAHDYHRNGWAPLPLPPRAKKHPPTGWTGTDGAWPSGADVHAWTEDQPGGNIALRLPPNVIGIDVDAYANKPGGLVLAQLEHDHGALPPTWRSTARDDGTSGIRFYTVPEGLRWPSVLGPGIEVIRHGHRYAVAWPSIHPDTGGTYRWITPDGATALADIPTPDALPELPTAWIAHFTGGELAGEQARAGLTHAAAGDWLATRGTGPACRATARALDRLLHDLTGAAGARHDAALTGTNRIIWAAGAGHTGATTALDMARQAFLLATAGDRAPGEAAAEWDRMVTGAVDLAAAAHPTDPQPDPCTTDPLAGLVPPRKEGPCPSTPPSPRPATSPASPPPSSSSSTSSPTPPSPSDSEPASPTSPAPTTSPDDAEPASWGRVDLGPYLDGTYKPLVPSLFTRTDGVSLLYPGKTHSFHGESESGKSLVLQVQCARLIATGRPVLYVDFEDDAASVTQRLLRFGATPQQIADHFDYRRPEVHPQSTPAELDAWMDMLARSYDLAVIDGVTDSLGIFGFSTQDNDEITKWMRTFPRNLADRTGAAVVVIDHVTKNAETRGRFALGGQAKMNAITGSAFTVEIDQPLGDGLKGIVVLRVGKDRHGYLRSRSGPMRAGDRTQETARIVIDSTGDVPHVTIDPPRQAAPADGSRAPSRMTGVMEKISRTLEAADGPLTGRGLQELVGGNKDRFAAGLRTLLEEGYVTASTGARGANMHSSSRPYRQREDPLSDLYGGDLKGLIIQRPPLSPTVPPLSPGDGDQGLSPVPLPEGGTGTVTSDQEQTTVPQGDRPREARIVERVVAGQRVRIDLDTGEVVD